MKSAKQMAIQRRKNLIKSDVSNISHLIKKQAKTLMRTGVNPQKYYKISGKTWLFSNKENTYMCVTNVLHHCKITARVM